MQERAFPCQIVFWGGGGEKKPTTIVAGILIVHICRRVGITVASRASVVGTEGESLVDCQCCGLEFLDGEERARAFQMLIE